jgi:hypothetical protein
MFLSTVDKYCIDFRSRSVITAQAGNHKKIKKITNRGITNRGITDWVDGKDSLSQETARKQQNSQLRE